MEMNENCYFVETPDFALYYCGAYFNLLFMSTVAI